MRRTLALNLHRRHGRLSLMRRKRMVEDANASLVGASKRQLRQVVLRHGFICRDTISPSPIFLRYSGEYVYDDPTAGRSRGSRLVPSTSHRPPAARIISPRGIAFRLYLISLCEAQLRQKPGEYARNTLSLISQDSEIGWTDLIAIPITEPRLRMLNEKKKRWIFSALSRLAKPDATLINLPHAERKRGHFEEFELLNECGPGDPGRRPTSYRIPRNRDPDGFAVPLEIFTNGWIHVLEDSELHFILMLLYLQRDTSSQPNPYIQVSESVRLKKFGMSRDGYGAHHMLAEFGVIDVQPGIGRSSNGTVDEGYHFDHLYHRLRIRPETFKYPALDVTLNAINRIIRNDAPLPINERLF